MRPEKITSFHLQAFNHSLYLFHVCSIRSNPTVCHPDDAFQTVTILKRSSFTTKHVFPSELSGVMRGRRCAAMCPTSEQKRVTTVFSTYCVRLSYKSTHPQASSISKLWTSLKNFRRSWRHRSWWAGGGGRWNLTGSVWRYVRTTCREIRVDQTRRWQLYTGTTFVFMFEICLYTSVMNVQFQFLKHHSWLFLFRSVASWTWRQLS